MKASPSPHAAFAALEETYRHAHRRADALALAIASACDAESLIRNEEPAAAFAAIASSARGVATALLQIRGAEPLAAAALGYGLDAVAQRDKWRACEADMPPGDGTAQALLALAECHGASRHEVSVACADGERRASIEALHARAHWLALLARSAETWPRVELLDALLWRWRNVLRGPVDALQEEYRALTGELHRGRLDLATIAGEPPIEDVVAVLDIVRERLFTRRRLTGDRAPRRQSGQEVEIRTGLQAMAAASGERLRAVGTRAMLVDESETGFGVMVPAGSACAKDEDLLGVRLRRGAPVVPALVVRREAAGSRWVRLGLKKLGVSAMPMRCTAQGRPTPLIFLAGPGAGARDALLMPETLYLGHAGRIHVDAEGRRFALRLRRARERGRGWVVACFEILETRRAVS